jgi:hypothetical protein
MLYNLTTRPDPIVYLIAVLPLSLAALALAYMFAARYSRAENEKAESAFGLGQAAIFGLIALILAFSFSFAAERFEARRALVIKEADAIGTTYLRGGFLPSGEQTYFRQDLIAYTTTRLETYANVSDVLAEERAIERGKLLQARLWAAASDAAHNDPRNLWYSNLANSVNVMIDVSEEQTAAFNNHVPRPILGLVLLCTIVGAVLLGLTFGRAKAPNAPLSVIFCVLFAATIFAIIDLDHPQGGFISVDVAPLQATLDDMKQ